MTLVVCDPNDRQRILEQRRASGGDRFDEVWDGVYLLMPLPNPEHQELVGDLTVALKAVVGDAERGRVYPGVNVSDRGVDWEHNYRCPDVAVYLAGNPARLCEAHWCGGPDLAVEVASRGDRAREKLPFYAGVGVRELLLVDREPWELCLFARRGDELTVVGTSTPDEPVALASEVLPIAFRLIAGPDRPRIEVVHAGDGRRWLA